MPTFQRLAMVITLVLVALLTALSAVGAFLGAERASALFNSPPLVVFWLTLLALLLVGLVAYPTLLRRPGLLLIHAGGVAILAGALWGSALGHRLQARLFGADTVRTGYMVIFEGERDNRVLAADGRTVLGTLPFDIYLADFHLIYYQDGAPPVGQLHVNAPGGQAHRLPARAGAAVELADGTRVTVARVFGNLRIALDAAGPVAQDEPGQDNPALEVEIAPPDEPAQRRYVFARHGGHAQGDPIVLQYLVASPGPVRDYLSELAVVRDNEPVLWRNVEVNHPLHYGGYHFYQSSYDPEHHRYTVLQVVSDSGLEAVYAGFVLLGLGTVGHFWLAPVLRRWSRGRAAA